jgi:Domain of unknown function (DUF5753)/Helix-turn-helix domain
MSDGWPRFPGPLAEQPARAAHPGGDLRKGGAGYEHAGPTVLRMLVGTHLRLRREELGISREDAAYCLRGSGSKISRMELGRVALKERDITDLLTLYGVSDAAEIDTVLTLAKRASAPGWWRAFGDVVPGWFEPYLGLEQGASVIRSYVTQRIPGLLQTEDYAWAAIQLAHGATAGAEIKQRVRLRMRRQEILARPEPTRLWAIIDEGVLRRQVGGSAVMRAQIQRLLDSITLPNVTIQVLASTATAAAAAAGPMAILRYPEWDLPDVVYLEQLTGAVYLERPADIERHWDVMNRLVTEAEAPEASAGILGQMLASS